jgi:uncharacterized 2Fe-2S/4Fe-4S cluster protein (DUF4445 family)
MTILFSRQQCQGHTRNGYLISCTECRGTTFMPSIKHLPEVVIANKFREKGWEVNATGKDYCPACKSKERQPKRKVISVVLPEQKSDSLNTVELKRVISSTGLPIGAIDELPHKSHRRFRVTLKIPPDGVLHVGQLQKAQSDIVSSFDAAIDKSYLRHDLVTESIRGTVSVQMLTRWYVTLIKTNRLEIAA